MGKLQRMSVICENEVSCFMKGEQKCMGENQGDRPSLATLKVKEELYQNVCENGRFT